MVTTKARDATAGMTELRETVARVALPAPDECKRIRLAAGATALDVALCIPVRESTVTRWERGEREPRRKHRRRYAEVLRLLAEASSDGQAD